MIKQRKDNHKVAIQYLPISILIFFKKLINLVRENRTLIIVSMSLALTWLAGFIIGMSYALGSMGGLG